VLSNELMAALALALFWVHVLLVAGSAAMDLRELLRLRGRLRRGLHAGTVRRGDGPDGAFAKHTVMQIGRGRGDGRVHFSDAAHLSEVFGGALELEQGIGREQGVVECAAVEAPVWPDLARRSATARAGSKRFVSLYNLIS
jgi:hypothetical protein